MTATNVKVFLPDGTTIEQSADATTPLKVDVKNDSITIDDGQTQRAYHRMPFLVVWKKGPPIGDWK